MDDGPLRFSGNDNKLYRALVTAIWRVLDSSYGKRSRGQRAVQGLPREAIGNPIQRLEALTKSLASEYFNPAPSKSGRGRLDQDREFYAIVQDQDFDRWLDPRSDLHALRIAGPRDWRLSGLCQSLPNYAKDYDVLHIDCGSLGSECRRMEGYGKCNSLVGPFLLSVFQFVVNSWKKRCSNANGSAMAADVATHLLQGILRASGADSRAAAPPGSGADPILGSLVLAIDRLGSNLVQVLRDALEFGRDAFQLGRDTKAPQVRPLMILLSGIHGFEQSPELGQLIHCIYKLHSVLTTTCGVCKILFTHEKLEHLKGLLWFADHEISDDELLGESSRRCRRRRR
jgi:hypothetical protein